MYGYCISLTNCTSTFKDKKKKKKVIQKFIYYVVDVAPITLIVTSVFGSIYSIFLSQKIVTPLSVSFLTHVCMGTRDLQIVSKKLSYLNGS